MLQILMCKLHFSVKIYARFTCTGMRNWGLSDGARPNPTGEIAQAGRSLTYSQLGFINPWYLKMPCKGKLVTRKGRARKLFW
jgi:hypothetical protein